MKLTDHIVKNDFIVILTGAGISAESGVKTFRDNDGLWENHRVEDVATPQAFTRNPQLVWRFYRERYEQSEEVQPNAGHRALVTLEEAFQDRFLLVTQNVDGLHTKAGSQRVLEMHGSLYTCFCVRCKQKFQMSEINLDSDIPPCPACGSSLRPDIVWFGETPYFLDEIFHALQKVTVFISIGTSGNVYPAASFIAMARQNGAKTISVNLAKPDNDIHVDYSIQGKAGEILPQLVREWIEGGQTLRITKLREKDNIWPETKKMI